MSNFDLKKFLIENKLTTNSKLVKEESIVDTKELDAKAAFNKAGIDMSRPVMYVIQDGGHGDPISQGKKDPIEMLKLFERMRQNAIADGRDDNYEFENELGNTVEGAEYKLAYFQEESDTHQIFQ